MSTDARRSVRRIRRRRRRGQVYTVTGQDWDSIVAEQAERGDERIVVNMGPQHPSTHGVLRLILEMEGESVTRPGAASATCTPASRRTWSSAPGPRASRSAPGWTTCRRCHNETTYCLGVERLLGHRGRDPREGQRHPGDDAGAQPDLLAPGLHRHRRHGDRRPDRDDHRLPRAGEGARRLRADHRPADEPRLHPARRRRPGPARQRARARSRPGRLDEAAPAGVRGLLQREPDLQGPARAASATSTWPAAWPSASPARRCASTGYDWDLRKKQPYCGYETYDFEVADLGHLRRVRPVPDPAERDVGEPEDRRAVRRAAGEDAAATR